MKFFIMLGQERKEYIGSFVFTFQKLFMFYRGHFSLLSNAIYPIVRFVSFRKIKCHRILFFLKWILCNFSLLYNNNSSCHDDWLRKLFLLFDNVRSNNYTHHLVSFELLLKAIVVSLNPYE